MLWGKYLRKLNICLILLPYFYIVTQTNTKDESTYLSLFKSGDPEAFTYFFNCYWEELYTVAYRHMRDEDTAKDLVQEVYIQIWEKRHLINSDYLSLRPYFFRALKNKVLNYYASEKVRKEVVEQMLYRMENTVIAGDSSSVYRQLEHIVEESVANLRGLMKTVYQMRTDNYSITQIAQKLGIAEQTVKNYLSEARAILKKELTQRFADRDNLLTLLITYHLIHDFLM